MNILEQNKEKINGVLETFDRMIINGYLLNLCNYRQFLYYLIKNNIKLKDIDKFALSQTESLCNNIESYVKKNKAEIHYLNSGKINKDEFVQSIFDRKENKEDLITVLSTVEVCNTMTVKPNHKTKKLGVTSHPTKCKHYYFYYNDSEFGWMYLKIQTWFPYNVQIYINGREYLSKIFDKVNIKYEMYNNSFSYIEDFDKAQELADQILNKKISDSFDGLVSQINNHLPNIESIFNHSYYWCINQCEFATDINFKSREDLSIFYKKLVAIEEQEDIWFDCIDRGGTFREFVPYNYSKATGIEYVLNHYHLDLTDAYAFGDSNNDLSMLSYVPHSIAMGNASPESLFAQVEYVTAKSSCGGIQQALEHYGFL